MVSGIQHLGWLSQVLSSSLLIWHLHSWPSNTIFLFLFLLNTQYQFNNVKRVSSKEFYGIPNLGFLLRKKKKEVSFTLLIYPITKAKNCFLVIQVYILNSFSTLVEPMRSNLLHLCWNQRLHVFPYRWSVDFRQFVVYHSRLAANVSR